MLPEGFPFHQFNAHMMAKLANTNYRYKYSYFAMLKKAKGKQAKLRVV